MATAKNDGFIEGLTTPWDFGSQDDTIYRADILWEPADTFSLRFTYNDEQKRGTDPKIHRMTRYDNSKLYAYNIMLGALPSAGERGVRGGLHAIVAVADAPATIPGFTAPTCGPNGWTPPPANTIGTRYTGVKAPVLDPSTHTTNYPDGFIGATTSQFGNYAQVLNAAGQPFETLGTTYTPNARMPDVPFGAGQVGKWQTKSDSMEDGITADLEYFTRQCQVGHHGQPEFRGDFLRLAPGPAAGHRLRRHRVPDHDRRHPARAREPNDRAAPVGQRVR